MFYIKDLLGKFLKNDRGVVFEKIQKLVSEKGIVWKNINLKLKNNFIIIDAHPVVKEEILRHKEWLLENLKKENVVDIR